MLVTTKGRYAMRLMTFIASFPEGQRVTLRKAAEAEVISLKYLEQLAHSLVEAGLLKSIRGHGGGYELARPATEIKTGDVLRAVEGTTVAVECAGLEQGCPRESACQTLSFWAGLETVIDNYVDGVMLSDLL